MKKVIKTEYWRGDTEKITYQEWDDGSWVKRIYNEHGVPVYITDSDGHWKVNILNAEGTDSNGCELDDGTFGRNTTDKNGNNVFYVGNHFTNYEKWITDKNGRITTELVSTTKRLSEDELNLFMQLPNIANDFDRAMAFKRQLRKVCPDIVEKLSSVELDTLIECCYKAALRELSNGYSLGSLISYPSEDWKKLLFPQHIATTRQEASEAAQKAAEEKAAQENQEKKRRQDELTAEAWHHYRIALEMYNWLPWWRKRRRDKPVPPSVPTYEE